MGPNNISDPDQALSETFCGAREFAIRSGDFVRKKISVSDNELEGICGFVESSLEKQIAVGLSGTPETVLSHVTSLRSRIGLGEASNADIYGQICLAMGYRQDNAKLALASALVLTSAGILPYSELIGHHIREGFGVRSNATASKAWYENAVVALESGQPPVVRAQYHERKNNGDPKVHRTGRPSRRHSTISTP